jgi:hypothetical protein
LLVGIRGSFDAIESGGRPTTVIAAGQEASAAGWALAGDATPWQVAVSIDGRKTIASETFFDRADVRETLRATSPAGWRIPLDTTGLAPGEHHLTAFAWPPGRQEGQYLEERTLTVTTSSSGARVAPAGDLDQAFMTAAARLREHQQPPGYWLTAYTSQARFQEPHPEMNTFLTALLVDVLNPVAAASSLEESVQRARRHLTAQIEPGGLVRYHGLPDAPGIGTLGAATGTSWRPPWPRSIAIGRPRVSIARGSPRARPTSVSIRVPIRTLPTSPSKCTCCCCCPKCGRPPAARCAKHCVLSSARIGCGSTIEGHR